MSQSNIKMWLTIFLTIFIIFLVSIFGLIKMFQKELNARTRENATLFTTAKSVFTFNYDSELEKKLKADSMKYEYNYVSIYYQKENEKLIPLTVETLEWAEKVTSEIFGEYDQRPFDMIYMDSEDLEKLSNAENVAGYYSNFDKVMGVYVHPEDVECILQELETPLYFFQRKILHEYAHYVSFKKIEEAEVFSGAFPKWFLEGVAEYVANDQTEVLYDLNRFEFLPLESITMDDDWEEARRIETADPYKQGYFSVKYLIQEYGKNIVVDLINNTNESEGFYKSFQQITGKTVVEFEQDVLTYYQ